MRRFLLALIAAASVSTSAQAPVDTATIARILREATLTGASGAPMSRSAIETHWWLSEVYGPRATGTPGYDAAAAWIMKRLTAWGLQNVHLERFPFGQGWTIERFSAHLVAPQTQVLIGHPRWYSPSTSGPITADVVQVKATTDAELAKYKGQLKGKIVIMQNARPVRMLDGRIVLWMTDADWAEAMTRPEPTAKPAGGGGGGGGQQPFAEVLRQFLVAEGVVALLDRGGNSANVAGGSDLSWNTQRVDGGTIFPTSGGSRNPNAAAPVPSATLAVEHYNRIVRLLEHGLPVRVEINIQTRFHPETDPAGNAANIIADIPGTSPSGEVVIMGAHFDTYPYATGATDNTTGSTAMIEAVRVIQALGLKPRRTIRLALWAAEEQGLLGSRTYVQRHYYDAAAGGAKPDHEKLSAYFNLDNGTGRILGIWGQGNLGAMKLFEQWGEPLKELGWKNVSPRSVSQTDHVSFDNAGLPGFQFIQERLEYNSRTHHSNMDTFDHMQTEDLVQQGAVAAVFAWHAANAPERLPRKPMPAKQGSGQ